jgi:hypothetical protein
LNILCIPRNFQQTRSIVPLTPPEFSRCRSEITVAAVVGIIGSVVSTMVGLVIAGGVAMTVFVFKKQYPGVTIYSGKPGSLEALQLVCFAVVVPIFFGVLGIFTARGIARLRPWARKSAIVWSIVSTLFCLLALTYLATLPSSPSPRATPILLLMLFLFPVNAWWLLLFFRPDVKSLFTSPNAPPHDVAQPRRPRENTMSRGIVAIAATLLVIVGISVALRRNAPMREIERSRNALINIKSWHYHTVRLIQSRTPETQDIDFLCPAFEHSVSSSINDRGDPEVREQIRNFSTYYNHVGDRWLTGQQNAPIFECGVGPLGTDEYSLPLTGIIEDGSAKRGQLLTVDGENCREYELSVETPHDPKEKTFVFTLCVNEQDHLPRLSRRTLPDTGEEGVSTFSQFNVMTTPLLPTEIRQ